MTQKKNQGARNRKAHNREQRFSDRQNGFRAPDSSSQPDKPIRKPGPSLADLGRVNRSSSQRPAESAKATKSSSQRITNTYRNQDTQEAPRNVKAVESHHALNREGSRSRREANQELLQQARVRGTSEKRKAKTSVPLLVGIGACIALGLGIGLVSLFSHSNDVEISVQGVTYEVLKDTTYADLIEQGYITQDAGNLLAIDGSILMEGKGEPSEVLKNGTNLKDLNQTVKPGDLITVQPGADTTEPSVNTEKTIPPTKALAQGDKFDFYRNPLHIVSEVGKAGYARVKTGVMSGIELLEEELEPMTPTIYGDFRPSIGAERKVVALTYDDGPHPTYTKQILNVLAKHDVKATFFMLGTSVEAHPHIAKTVADAGHQVASHSYSHAPEHYLSRLEAGGVEHQISTAQKVIQDATGVETKTLRPPGGNLNAVGALAGTPWVDAYVGWDIDSRDFEKPGTKHIVDRVSRSIHPGGIVLMHDGGGDRTQTVEASDILIGELIAQGYEFVTVDELIDMTKPEIETL